MANRDCSIRRSREDISNAAPANHPGEVVVQAPQEGGHQSKQRKLEGRKCARELKRSPTLERMECEPSKEFSQDQAGRQIQQIVRTRANSR